MTDHMHDDAQQAREPGEEHPVLKQCDELHDMGFKAGWNGAIEEAAKLVNEFDCHLAGYPNDEAKDYYESGVADACNMLEDRINALASQPSPAATVETDADLPTYQDVRGILPSSSAANVEVLRQLVALYDAFWASKAKDQAAAYYSMIKGHDKVWEDARAAITSTEPQPTSEMVSDLVAGLKYVAEFPVNNSQRQHAQQVLGRFASQLTRPKPSTDR